MLSILKKLRRNSAISGRFNGYFFYALGEIILIVIGILIALQIDRWNDQSRERSEAIAIYESISQQILEDRNKLAEAKAKNTLLSKAYERANEIIELRDTAKGDSLALFAMLLSQYSDFYRDDPIYNNLAVSGQLKLLKNKGITRNLQKLDLTYNTVNKSESVHWDIIMQELSPELRSVVNYNTMKPVKIDGLYAVELQNIFVESIYLTKIKGALYDQAITEIDSILLGIQGELKIQ
jgi:hypothetical protein